MAAAITGASIVGSGAAVAGPRDAGPSVAGVLLGGGAAGAAVRDAGPSTPPSPSDSPLGVSVSRITGADRFDLAAEIAKRVSPWTSNVVYLASGVTFPDALSAGPAAAINSAPLLLVAPDAVPASVAAALTRLDPASVVVVGGTASVSDAVLGTVRALLPRAAVRRIAGADRYEVSRAVVSDAFPHGSFSAVVATGRDFPDALSGGAVAGGNQSPVVLVDGTAPGADTATQTLLSRTLGVGLVVLVGGPVSMSTGIERTILPEGLVLRTEGANRYEVSLNLAETGGVTYDTVYLVSGSAFPDALAGGVLAAKTASAMFVVPPDCVPQGVLNRISTKGTKDVILIGGPATLGTGVASLTACSF